MIGLKKRKKKENLLNSSKKIGDSRYRARYLGCEGYALTPCATRTIESLRSLRTYTDGDIMYTGHNDTQADITY